MKDAPSFCQRPLSWLFMAVITVYQHTVSRLLGDRCRFFPSCSSYTMQSIAKHGIIRGSIYGIWRIMRCHPWCSGGPDPVP